MAKKPDNRSEDVKRITRTKKYKEIENDLRQQLEANGTYGKFFDDMIDDYMAMYVTKTLLIEDIQKRGTIVKYNNGGGQSGMKKNEAVEMFNKTNAQMLKLLAELGLKANAMSEHTKDLQPEELAELKRKVAGMDDDALAEFRNGFDPDKMGFYGEEGAAE